MAKWLRLLAVAAMLASPALAQSEAPSVPAGSSAQSATPDAAAIAEWQGIIHSQVQAFRDHDGAAALSFAATPFHEQYSDPDAFLLAILNAGYAPIMESRSESFGPYEMMSPDVVDQDVKFVGNDGNLYEAVYRLARETGGWRVSAVALVKAPDVGT